MRYLTSEPIDVSAWHDRAGDPRDGASVEFLGIVRGEEEGRRLAALDYEAYEPMAERLLGQLVDQAKQRWPLHEVCVRHRIGRVAVGEIAVLIGVQASHRDAAFAACRFLIDAIKRDAPIWKRGENNGDVALSKNLQAAGGEPFGERHVGMSSGHGVPPFQGKGGTSEEGRRANGPLAGRSGAMPRTECEPGPAARGVSTEPGDRWMPLTGHLEEFRRRLLLCLLMLALATAASFSWAGPLIDWLRRPAGSALPTLAFLSPPEAILAYLKVAVSAGLALCMPLVLHELWAFISPGLTIRERRYGLGVVWWGTGLFFAGGAFAYGVVLPVSLKFLLGFGGEWLEPVISVSRYLSFTTTVILACGVVFQLPLLVLFLTKLNIVSPQRLRRKWRYAVLVMAIAAAVLTPTTDVATMVLMTAPMLVLYEASIWIATWAAKKAHRDG